MRGGRGFPLRPKTGRAADVTVPGQTILPAGIASSEAFGLPQLNRRIYPSATASAEAFGAPVVFRQQFILPSGVPSSEAFGAPVTFHGIGIFPVGIASAEAFGTTTLPTGAGRPRAIKLQNKGIKSAQAFGIPKVVKPGVSPAGIPSAQAFGTPGIVLVPNHIAPGGIPSAEAFGTPSLSRGNIAPSGIASAQAFGTPALFGPGFVLPLGIASQERLGVPRVTVVGKLTVQPTGVPSAEAFGPNDIVTTPTRVLPLGIVTALAFGQARVLLATDPAVLTPRDVLTNPLTSFAYQFPINHETEAAIELARSIRHGAPNAEAILVRQQDARGGIVLHLQGAILDPVQAAELGAFFDACEETTLIFHHANGDEYDVIVSRYDAPRRRSQLHSGALTYRRYSLDLDVINVRGGSLLELGT